MKITREMYAGETDVFTDLMDIVLRSSGLHPYGGLSLGLIVCAFEDNGARSFNQAVSAVRREFEPLLEFALSSQEAVCG